MWIGLTVKRDEKGETVIDKGGVILLVGLAFGSVTLTAFGQKNQKVVSSGVENVLIDSAAHRVYYEQRLYRNPAVGMLELEQELNREDVTEFVPLYQGVPIAGYSLDNSKKTVLLPGNERRTIGKVIPVGPKQYKVDFRLQPEVIANFGFKQDPFQTKTNLLLQSQLYIRRGLVLNLGILFPLVNNYDNQPMNVRPGPIYLNQFLALGKANFVSASVGLFYDNQYGLNAQFRRSNLTKSWSFGLETSVTGTYYFPERGIYYEPLQRLMALGDIAYRINSRDITLKLTAGQFLYEDRGVRVDFIRQFYSVEIGLFATKTTRGSTAGFNFAIPIPPGRIAQSRRFRLRTTEEFRWEYTYNGSGANVGSRFRVGNQLDALLRQYHSSYIHNQVNN